MEADIDVHFVKGAALNRTLPKQTLLPAEDLLKNFQLVDGTVFLQFRENKYNFFDWDLLGGNANLLDNLVYYPETKISGSIFLFEECVMQLYPIIDRKKKKKKNTL